MTRLLDENLTLWSVCNCLGGKWRTVRADRLPTRVGVNLESSCATSLITVLNTMDPFNVIPWACNCVVIYIALYAENTWYSIEIMIDGIHGETEQENRERPAHINSNMHRSGRQ